MIGEQVRLSVLVDFVIHVQDELCREDWLFHGSEVAQLLDQGLLKHHLFEDYL